MSNATDPTTGGAQTANSGAGVSESHYIVVLLEAGLALAILGGILVALADQRGTYPIALGIVLVAALYVLLEKGKAVTTLDSVIKWAGSHAGA